jgi:hypothetical protein
MLNQALRGNAAIGRKMQFGDSFYLILPITALAIVFF